MFAVEEKQKTWYHSLYGEIVFNKDDVRLTIYAIRQNSLSGINKELNERSLSIAYV